jgi:uncharacterized secreted protein with C-terminal beta-propeller domain
MRKSTLFISAALTTFMLAVMFGVVSAYQNIVKSSQPVVEQSQPTTEVVMVSAPMPTQITSITPEEAATLASQVLNRTDLFSAEVAQLEGVDVYLITFSSGDLVYVSFDGKILSFSKIAVTVVAQASHRGGNNQNNAPAEPADDGGEHHDDGDEHESGDD